VLINGERPTTKSENLEDILKRISASAVERIELIRGGAPGIDMQGQTILANVVIKSTVQVEKVANLQTYLYPDGLFGPLLEFQASRRDGINEIEGSVKATIDRTDQTFDGGARVTSFPDGRPTIKEALKGYDEIQNYVARGAIQRAAPGGKIRVNGKIEYFSFDRDVVYTQYAAGPRPPGQRRDRRELDRRVRRPLRPQAFAPHRPAAGVPAEPGRRDLRLDLLRARARRGLSRARQDRRKHPARRAQAAAVRDPVAGRQPRGRLQFPGRQHRATRPTAPRSTSARRM
jgi:hypothetical protein